MPPASASILSPNANPFVPISGHYDDGGDESSFKAIYVNGKAELILAGDHPEHEIIHNIPDEAIDEVFPPTAADAAELEALDNFLTMMVNLSYLEESEEKARTTFNHIKKRWESRRKEVTKARSGNSAMSGNNHTMTMLSPDETDLVRNGHHLKKASNSSMDSRKREKFATKHLTTPKMVKGIHGYGKPIQQPRKQN